jgi:hypothetical protein
MQLRITSKKEEGKFIPQYREIEGSVLVKLVEEVDNAFHNAGIPSDHSLILKIITNYVDEINKDRDEKENKWDRVSEFVDEVLNR